MRRTIAILAALAAGLLVAGASNAGPLVSTWLTITASQATLGPTIPLQDPTGAYYTDGVASVAAGDAFAGLSVDAPLTTGAPLTNLHLSVGSNGRIRIDAYDPLATGTVTAPLAVNLNYQNRYGTLFTVPLPVGAGSAANPAVTTRVASVPFVGSVLVTVTATGWHLGSLQATGLTASGSPVPNVTAQGHPLSGTGSANDPGAFMTMVSLTRIQTSGLYVSNTAAAVTLYLSYDNVTATIDPVPEAGSALLLAAAAAGLVGHQRARRGRR